MTERLRLLMLRSVDRSLARRSAVILSTAIITLVVVLAGTSCGDKSLDGDNEANLSAAQDKVMETCGVPGVISGVWTQGGSWVRAKGDGNIDPETPIKETDRVRIGSVTKTFTAVVVLQLVDEGGLSLDDTVDGLGFDVPNGEKITVRMLLNHTSGLFDYVADPGFLEVLESDPTKHYAPRQMVDIGTAHDPLFGPGEDYAYSNTNYILLGMIIENVTGDSYEAEVEGRIIDRLGMENTFFPDGVEITGAHAYGYSRVDGELKDVTTRDTSVAWAAGALVSTLEDLRIWAEALAGGELLSEETYREQLEMVDEPGSKTGEKMGLGIVSRGSYLGFSGAIPGYRTEMFRDPDEEITVINLFNELSLNDYQLVERSAYYNAFAEMSAAVCNGLVSTASERSAFQ